MGNAFTAWLVLNARESFLVHTRFFTLPLPFENVR